MKSPRASNKKTAHKPKPDQVEFDRQEMARYQAARQQIEDRGLRDFVDWLCEPRKIRHGMVVQLCEHPTGVVADSGTIHTIRHWEPLDLEAAGAPLGEELFAAYFGIDMAAVERHRRRLLDRLADETADAASAMTGGPQGHYP